MRRVSVLSAVSAGCAHTVGDDDDDAVRLANLADDCVVDEAAENAAACEHASGPRSTDGGCPEMDLPRTMSSPLVCMGPETSTGGNALCLQCALKPGVKADSVLLHYRIGEESYHGLPMRLAPNGWFRATIPAPVMNGLILFVFYDALDGIDRVATEGQWDSPSAITICRGRK